MIFWRIKDYCPGGDTPIQDWYDDQEDEVREEFDFAIGILARTEDWSTVPEFKTLKKTYTGLYEILIDVKLSFEKKKRHYRALGVWQPDSSDFIILLMCRQTGRGRFTYIPPLQRALELKAEWERNPGEVNDRKT